MSAEIPTTKPWVVNRDGDPRQLVHEASQLEALSQAHRRQADKLRLMATEADTRAAQLKDAANDYRAWAKERSAETHG